MIQIFFIIRYIFISSFQVHIVKLCYFFLKLFGFLSKYQNYYFFKRKKIYHY